MNNKSHFGDLKSAVETHVIIQQVKSGKVTRELLEFKGFGGCSSKCMVHIYQPTGEIFGTKGFSFVVFQDLNKGTSVTNASEWIATLVLRNHRETIDREKTFWFECYPYYGGNYDIDQITYEYDLTYEKFFSPSWKPIRNELFVEFLRSDLIIDNHV